MTQQHLKNFFQSHQFWLPIKYTEQIKNKTDMRFKNANFFLSYIAMLTIYSPIPPSRKEWNSRLPRSQTIARFHQIYIKNY